MPALNVTLIQAPLAWHAPADNRAYFERVIRGLDQPAGIVILPEMFTTGFTMDTPARAESMQGETVAWMATLAAELGITLCGSLIIEEAGRCHNRFCWLPPGGPARYYDKRHLFRMAGEHEHFTAGTRRLVFEQDGWRICPLVCYDLRFPVWSRGANCFDLMIYVANWPAARRSAWNVLLPARAVENQCYVAGVNRVGEDGNGIGYVGDSAVYDPFGTSLAKLGDQPGAVSVQLERDTLDRYREKFPAWQDADRYELRGPPAGSDD